MNRQLCWFRSDLRWRDNRALSAAMATGPTIAVYIATPEQWRLHDDADIKLDFWRRSLACLEQALNGFGVRLCYLEVPDYAAIAEALSQLARGLEISTVHCNREYPLNERQRDESCAKALAAQGISWQSHQDRLLIDADGLLTQNDEPYKVFTPFSKRARDRLQLSAAESPDRLASHHSHSALATSVQSILPDTSLAELSWPQPTAERARRWAERWPAGEEAGLRGLQGFCETALRHYRRDRDFPAIEGTSELSPHLTAGTLSNRQCWRAAQAMEAGDGAHTWCNELLWRDFYQYVMHHFPHVCRGRNWRDDVGHVHWREAEHDFQAWCQGETGIPLVDAAMKQLLDIGWMHNRLRMVSAMFLSKNLLLDWRKGERWFMQHLVDGEFAANNGGWQWSASTGTDAAPYFRVFNPVTQSERFDPEGDFIRRYVPALRALRGKAIHAPHSGGLFAPAGYPSPIVDLKASRQRAIEAFRTGP